MTLDYSISLGNILTLAGVIITWLICTTAVILKIGSIETKVDAMWQIFLKRIDGPRP